MKTFTDQGECCQAIAQALVAKLPVGWQRADTIAKLDEESVDLESSYVDSAGKKTEMLAAYEVALYCHQLAPLVSTPEKGLYKTCVISVESSGRYNFKYEY
ncbi:hypothetical protein [Nevskia ramosa]|uniref:hypothetical protein n=1 Tax=Nevskia ramosa TaxID=64002 RepID=UPI00235556D0|nr:hypothetical protein [Nevskia ramosa]